MCSGRFLKLARDIGTARSYVGYSFFVLLALCKKCRPLMWEGASRVDIVKTFAPWALAQRLDVCVLEGVCCCLAPSSDTAELLPVSSEHPLHECRHFIGGIHTGGSAAVAGSSDGGSAAVAGSPDGGSAAVAGSSEAALAGSVPSAMLSSDERSITQFYDELGVTLVGTVMDGDCGLDLSCMMLGLPQTFENRQALREEPSGLNIKAFVVSVIN